MQLCHGKGNEDFVSRLSFGLAVTHVRQTGRRAISMALEVQSS